MSRLPRVPLGDLLVTLSITVAMLGPALLPGYVLRGDMVFVPNQPWKAAWLGLGGDGSGYPRAVPMDALVSALTQVLPGWLVQKMFLAGALVVGGLGAGRLVAGRPNYARAAAIVVFLWNPYVLERLLIGQWALVVGYALLPWVALAASRSVRDLPAGLPMLGLALAASAVASPSSGLIAGLVAACVSAVGRAWAATSAALVITALVNLTWIVPALFADTVQPSGDEASPFEAFAARAESPLGLVASLLSLGGIWKTSVVPAERTGVVVVGLALVLSLSALAAAVRSARRRPRSTTAGLAVAGAIGLVVAAAPALDPVSASLAAVAEWLPGLGILRDSHRYLAPLSLLLVLGTAGLVTAVLRRARPGREALVPVAGLIAIAPVLLLPSAFWGALGELRPVQYPAEWSRVASIVAAEPDARTVVLPWAGSYRGFDWNGGRAVLDPAPRFFPGEVLIDDRVLLGNEVMPAESAVTQRVGEALSSEEPEAALRRLGVRWVLVEKGHGSGVLLRGSVAHDGATLRLIDLGPSGTFVPAAAGPNVTTFAVIAADGVFLVVVGLSFFGLVIRPDTMRGKREA